MANAQYGNIQNREYTQQAADNIFIDAMTRLYGWIALGVLVTGIVAWLSHQAGVLEGISTEFGMWGVLGVLGVWLVSIVGLSFIAGRVSPAIASIAYLGFTAITGVMISSIFWTYTGNTIMVAFVLTATSFTAMSVVGYTTKRDLSGLGSICAVGLIGVIIGLVVNLFVGSGALSIIISMVALPIFLGLTVYETKQIKESVQESAMRGDSLSANQVAISGVISLYLTLLNIFVFMLSILGIFDKD